MAKGGPEIQGFFDEQTSTISYLVWDPATKQGAVVDPVLNFNLRRSRVSTKSADAILAAAVQAGIRITRVLETHAHADHLSAAPYIKQKTGATIGIGEHISDVQKIFKPIFNATGKRVYEIPATLERVLLGHKLSRKGERGSIKKDVMAGDSCKLGRGDR